MNTSFGDQDEISLQMQILSIEDERPSFDEEETENFRILIQKHRLSLLDNNKVSCWWRKKINKL